MDSKDFCKLLFSLFTDLSLLQTSERASTSSSWESSSSSDILELLEEWEEKGDDDTSWSAIRPISSAPDDSLEEASSSD